MVATVAQSSESELYQLIYVSRITSAGLSGASTLNDIAKSSIKNNQANDITGILCYGNGYFFQYIEGSEQALTNLKNQLLMDDRHKDLKTLDFSAISERKFQDWSLRSIILERWLLKDPKMKSLLPFKPFDWEEAQVTQFVEALQRYYESEEGTERSDDQPIKYSALGLTLSKVVGEHQAFFLIQTVLAVLIVVTLIWVLMADKIGLW